MQFICENVRRGCVVFVCVQVKQALLPQNTESFLSWGVETDKISGKVIQDYKTFIDIYIYSLIDLRLVEMFDFICTKKYLEGCFLYFLITFILTHSVFTVMMLKTTIILAWKKVQLKSYFSFCVLVDFSMAPFRFFFSYITSVSDFHSCVFQWHCIEKPFKKQRKHWS